METSVNFFNPPPEYSPPWPANGQLESLFHIGCFASVLRAGDMALHSLGYNIHDDKNLALSNIAGLLLKDSLCSPCWNLRGTPEFVRRLQSLMRPRYCTGCSVYHASVLFDSGRSNLCRGWTGRVRICAHRGMTWKQHQRKPRSHEYHCNECRTTFRTAREHIRQVIPLTSLREWQTGQEEGLTDSDEQPTSLRAVLAKCDKAVCPHLQVNDPTLRTYLLHSIQTSQPTPEEWAQSAWIEAPLVDFWDKPWNCPVCKASFLVRYNRPQDDESRNDPTSISLVVTRSILKSLANPSDSRWLSQLEPPSAAARAPDAKGVTWCDDAGCGTSRQHRKEALLVRTLELGVAAPVPGPARWPTYPGERSRWLWFALRWFWTHETPAMRRVWRMTDAREEDVSAALQGVRWGSPGVSLGCNWQTAAVLHAAMLHDAPATAGDAPVVAAAVLGGLGAYEAYFRGRGPLLRDAFGYGVAAVLMRVLAGWARLGQDQDEDEHVWIRG
ncbi:uncharacterized protein PG998_006366 [Apiospora kogelbergensis]|uniref:uncharacterized protein n=1 Tax=Apiospora kogelbergensis TaxID=1337665 RepID=UPI00312ED325